LVLSRQRDETIMIGDDIELTVVDIRGDKVRIGIKAPSQVAVHRKEIYEAIKRENEQAARLEGGRAGCPPRGRGVEITAGRGEAAGPLNKDGSNRPAHAPQDSGSEGKRLRPPHKDSFEHTSLNQGGLPWLGSTATSPR
jgi:carbon storage regulator